MKLIEKLGKDAYYKWAEPFPPDAEIIVNPETMYSGAYAEGFRKAREMAATKCWEASDRHTHSMGRDAYKDASLMIEHLGEEEA